jgi:hypothetical protein
MLGESIVAYGRGVYGYHPTARKEVMAGMYKTELMAITSIQAQLVCKDIAKETWGLVECMHLRYRFARHCEDSDTEGGEELASARRTPTDKHQSNINQLINPHLLFHFR